MAPPALWCALAWRSQVARPVVALVTSPFAAEASEVPIEVPDVELVEGELSVGPAQCEVRKLKRKGDEVKAQLMCSTGVKPVVIDAAALSVGGVDNDHKKAGPMLVWPDEPAKFDVEVVGADGAMLQWGTAVRAAEPVPVPFEVAPVTASW